MKTPFKPGDTKNFTKVVAHNELAHFDAGAVHPFYATFALAQDAEWVGRLFVLDMLEEGEEGIGHFVNIEHLSPALEGEQVAFTAVLESVIKNEIICNFEAVVAGRMIAKGSTGQKIVKKERLDALQSKIHGKEES